MKLLFDENLSPKLSTRLSDIFPDSLHVRDVGMKATIDPIVWNDAKDNDLMIVSKDAIACSLIIALKICNCIQTSNKVRYISLTHPTGFAVY
jgi:predicted nuclease of predicted toxin-antitoxin system